MDSDGHSGNDRSNGPCSHCNHINTCIYHSRAGSSFLGVFTVEDRNSSFHCRNIVLIGRKEVFLQSVLHCFLLILVIDVSCCLYVVCSSNLSTITHLYMNSIIFIWIATIDDHILLDEPLLSKIAQQRSKRDSRDTGECGRTLLWIGLEGQRIFLKGEKDR